MEVYSIYSMYYSALLWQKEASDKSDILVKEQNVSVICTDVNGISWCLTEHISYQDECLCIKFGLEEEHIRWNMKTSITQIWMVCHLLSFAKVGQYYTWTSFGLRTSWTRAEVYSILIQVNFNFIVQNGYLLRSDCT